MAFDLRLHPELAILPAVLLSAKIVDLVLQRTDSVWRAHFCFRLFRERAKTVSLAVDLCPVMELDFRPVATADFFAARSLPAPGSTCPENFCSGCSPIDFGIAPAVSVVVAAGFDLCRSCSVIATAVAVGPGSVRRRFAADFCLSCFAVEAAALAFVLDVVSIARFSF